MKPFDYYSETDLRKALDITFDFRVTRVNWYRFRGIYKDQFPKPKVIIGTSKLLDVISCHKIATNFLSRRKVNDGATITKEELFTNLREVTKDRYI